MTAPVLAPSDALGEARPAVFWTDRPGAPEACPPIAGEVRCTLLVVGGGLTGLWTAYTLISADFRRLIHMLRLTGINVTLELEPENAAGG